MIASTFIICIQLFVGVFSDSSIDFRVTPTSIKPGLTNNLTFFCGLNETLTDTSGLVGRDLSLNSDLADPEDARDVTTTTADVVSIVSIVISDSSDVVATVSSYQPASLLSKTYTNAVVTGDLTPAAGVKGYLQVVFTRPTETMSGDFQCEVNAFTSKGHVIVLKSSVTVDTAVPTLQDMMSRLDQLETDYRERVNQLTQDNLHQRQVIDQLNTSLVTLQQNVTNNTHLQQTLTQDMTNLQENVANNTHVQQTLSQNIENIQQSMTAANNTQHNLINKLRHTETGEFNCVGRDMYNGGTSNRYYDYSETFSHQYETPPTLQYSVIEVRGLHPHDDVYFSVDLTQVSRTDFSVRCYALGGSQVFNLFVQWIATSTF